jgi:hypothetical protein
MMRSWGSFISRRTQCDNIYDVHDQQIRSTPEAYVRDWTAAAALHVTDGHRATCVATRTPTRANRITPIIAALWAGHREFW